MRPLLQLNEITKQFGGVRALAGVSLAVHPGEIHCLAGENGSGKSTLIKIIAGVYRPQSGTIRIGKDTRRHVTAVESTRLGIQVIYQDLALFPNLTVAENLALNTLVEQARTFVNWKSVRRIATAALDNLGISLDLRRRVEELPVAQKQLVAIARALLHDAKLIVMDEPTSALTGSETDALFGVMRKLQRDGVAILFVSHKLREMLAIGDRFTILRNGAVVAEGPTREFDESRIALKMTGKDLDRGGCPPPSNADQRVLLEVRNLSGRGIHDVSFDLSEGEIVGVTGLLGSGQTELARALFGLEPATRGTVTVGGKRGVIRTVADAIARGIAYVPEDRLAEGLFLAQSVGRNTCVASLDAFAAAPCGLLNFPRIGREVQRWLSELAVRTPSTWTPVRALSGGNQQRVVLARWLATSPRVLILNGPTIGVDVRSKAEIHEKLRELASRGMGILMISDDLPELVRNSRRVLILHEGKIVHELAGEELREEVISQRLGSTGG